MLHGIIITLKKSTKLNSKMKVDINFQLFDEKGHELDNKCINNF